MGMQYMTNETFCSKLESVQYNAALATLGQSAEHRKIKSMLN